jgi:hypothetical protein
MCNTHDETCPPKAPAALSSAPAEKLIASESAVLSFPQQSEATLSWDQEALLALLHTCFMVLYMRSLGAKFPPLSTQSSPPLPPSTATTILTTQANNKESTTGNCIVELKTETSPPTTQTPAAPPQVTSTAYR